MSILKDFFGFEKSEAAIITDHWIRGWLGPRACLDAMMKKHSHH